MKELEGLTHHEALRYDYLSKNIHYLNAKEEAELAYLKAKLAGESVAEMANPQNADKELPVYPKAEKMTRHSQALPTYPKTESRNQRPVASPLPPYPDLIEEEHVIKERAKGLPAYPSYSRKKQKSQHVWPEAAPAIAQAPKQPRPAKVKPQKVRRKRRFSMKRLFQWLGIVILLTLIGMVIMFFKGMSDITSGRTNFTPAQTEVFNGVDAPDGTNILILGSDKRITQNSTDARTDTIMVMNVGGSDGKVKLVSFMRDTLVNMPGYSADDYETTDLKLNASFNFGEQQGDEGAEMVRQILKHNFDIDIKYYVMIDFETFAEGVNTLFPEGVEIDAQFATVSGVDVSEVEVPDDLGYAQGGPQYQTIAEGLQRMDGKTLLNYARFRSDDEADFGRTKRQQQVLGAIMSQVKNPTKLFTGSAALGKIYALTSTNVSYPLLISEGLGVLLSGQDGIQQTTIPAQGDWVDTYDMYGGLGLEIDRYKYQQELAEMGLR